MDEEQVKRLEQEAKDFGRQIDEHLEKAEKTKTIGRELKDQIEILREEKVRISVASSSCRVGQLIPFHAVYQKDVLKAEKAELAEARQTFFRAKVKFGKMNASVACGVCQTHRRDDFPPVQINSKSRSSGNKRSRGTIRDKRNEPTSRGK